MTTKPLFVLIGNAGDGSYYTNYTFNAEWTSKQKARDDLDWEYDIGVDADGFHYYVLNVPEECTYESLGISKYHIADEDF